MGLSDAWEWTKGAAGDIAGVFTNPFTRKSEYGQVDPSGKLADQSGAADRFADHSTLNYSTLGGEANRFRRDMAGRPSVSEEMLRQGLQQNQAQQMSMAAGARPGQAPMAARTAMMNAGRAASGMSGQAAVARMQEQQMRDQQIAQMLMQQRQQELQATLGGRGQAIQGQGMLEQARTSRYASDMGTPTGTENLLSTASGFIPGGGRRGG